MNLFEIESEYLEKLLQTSINTNIFEFFRYHRKSFEDKYLLAASRIYLIYTCYYRQYESKMNQIQSNNYDVLRAVQK
jgi:hypothetical protein